MSFSRRETVLQIKNLTKVYEQRDGSRIHLFHGLSFEVRSGESVAVLGRNGSGKSTLLRIVAGIEIQTGGHVDVVKGRDEVAYLAQNVAEYSGRDLTVCEQVNLGNLRSQRRIKDHFVRLSNGAAKERAAKLLSPLGMGLENRLDTHIRHLSGGQVQAVMLATLIGARPPRLILLDEHSAALDETVQETAISWLRNILRTFDSSLLFVTHDQDLPDALATRKLNVPHSQHLEAQTPEEV